jgi:hypothetical protein
MAFITRPNSWIVQDEAPTTQLTYALKLNPAPLTVSIAGRDPVLGSLEFVITNPTQLPIEVTSIIFTIQVGTQSTDLTPSTANTLTSVDNNNWQIESPGSVISGSANYIMLPATGTSYALPANASVVVQIYNFATVENPGSSQVTIKEVAGKTGFTSFQVTTFPSGFYFSGLSATAVSGSQLVPVSQVGAGSSIILVWNSSVTDVTSITIYYSSAAEGQQTATPTDSGFWTSPALTTDTVFTVMVTVTVEGGSPLSGALSTSVVIRNPQLIAASLQAGTATIAASLQAGTATVSGSLTAGTISALGVINGFGTVPIGAILDWWMPVGSKVTPPANFAICDGSKISDPDSPFNGFNTPNLVQRFTYGATNIGEIGQTGGSSTANVSITSPLPSNTGNIPNSAPAAANTSAGTIIRNNPSTSFRFAMSNDNVSWNDGQHIHNLGGSVTGSTSISTLPPYVCLLKIVRIK